MAQVFISHSEEDMEIADAIAHGLEAAGYSTWYYERDSLPGIRYLQQVADAIADAEALLIIISPASLESDQVTKEIDVAYERRKRLVPVLHRITHSEWQIRRTDWRQALGAATSISVPADGPSGIIRRLAGGLAALGLHATTEQLGDVALQQSDFTVTAAQPPSVIVSEPRQPVETKAPDGASRPAFPIAPTPVRGDTRINPIDGAEMIWIPPGPFLMGDEDLEDNPRRTVTLSGYWIYKNVVTVGMYKTYCEKTGAEMPKAPEFNRAWSIEDHPVVRVCWHEAEGYCKWAGVSLPTEAQWEKAARGTDGRKFPWGEEFDAGKVWASKRAYCDARCTTDVGHYGISPYGCTDMAGNVWQWCSDWYDAEYMKTATAVDPQGPPAGEDRVPRGGSWLNYYPDYFRAAFRGNFPPDKRNDGGGFRCVFLQE